MCSGGETLRASKFRHGKTYALELNDEKLACVVLGAIFGECLFAVHRLSERTTVQTSSFAGWPTRPNPTRPISLTLTQTPLPLLTAWSQFIYRVGFAVHGLSDGQSERTTVQTSSLLLRFRLANPTQPDPTNIANANPYPPTPADRVVPIHSWRLVIVPMFGLWFSLTVHVLQIDNFHYSTPTFGNKEH